MKRPVVLALVVLLLSSLACSFGSALPGGSAEPADPNLLFKDDFSNTSSGWDKISDTDGITDYADGKYRILINQTQFDYWSTPGLSFDGDVRVEVDATKSAGPDDNDFGVICRYTETDSDYSFYYFIISSEGYAAIAKVKGQDQTYLTDALTEPHSVIKLGDGVTNHVRGDCIGSTLTLYVNGEEIVSATDSDLTSGDVGLLAGTFDTAGTDILFDDFIVTKP